MFISIGKLVGRSSHTVRNDICDYMASHLDTVHQSLTIADWIKWQEHTPEPSLYIQRMRQSSTWGGAMELAVATKTYGTDIIVVNGMGKRVAEFKWRDECTARVTLVLQWTGAHYEPVRILRLNGHVSPFICRSTQRP